MTQQCWFSIQLKIVYIIIFGLAIIIIKKKIEGFAAFFPLCGPKNAHLRLNCECFSIGEVTAG